MSIILDGTTGITTPGLTNTGTETLVNLTTTGNTTLGDASTDTLNVGNGGLIKDASGNVGVGVTPSAWSVLTPAVQIGGAGSFITAQGSSVDALYIGTNAHFDGTNWKYKTTNEATYYLQNDGAHKWYNAPSGTAGNTITFAQAMTLNTSGGLQTLNTIGVGNTTPSTSGAGITFPATQSASSDANTLDDYEEGSCTLVLSDSSGNNATMGANNAFRYIKIGRMVSVSGTLNWVSVTGVTTSRTRITGLPFTASSVNAMRWPAVNGSSSSGSFNITRSEISFGLDFNNSFLWGTKVTGNNVDNNLDINSFGTSGTLYAFQITYFTEN